LKVFYPNHYDFKLPPEHTFPIGKYALIHQILLERMIFTANELIEAPFASRETVTLAHSPEYFDAIYNGTIDPAQERQIGFPITRPLVLRSLASVGGTIAAAEESLQNGFSGNLAGGTHHASKDRGAGYCIFNDVAIATLHLLKNGLADRIAVIDLDAHQGNGNSAILGKVPEVFIFSMHSDKNFPLHKVPSSLDIGVPNGAGDVDYLPLLEGALARVFAFYPDIIFYIAGADPLKGDRLGKLALTMEGMAERDRMVLKSANRCEIPIVVVMGGGYSNPVTATVEAHVQTYRIAREIFK
jgi:acetoin utilization deacetylase AcuC-like enzyme